MTPRLYWTPGAEGGADLRGRSAQQLSQCGFWRSLLCWLLWILEHIIDKSCFWLQPLSFLDALSRVLAQGWAIIRLVTKLGALVLAGMNVWMVSQLLNTNWSFDFAPLCPELLLLLIMVKAVTFLLNALLCGAGGMKPDDDGTVPDDPYQGMVTAFGGKTLAYERSVFIAGVLHVGVPWPTAFTSDEYGVTYSTETCREALAVHSHIRRGFRGSRHRARDSLDESKLHFGRCRIVHRCD